MLQRWALSSFFLGGLLAGSLYADGSASSEESTCGKGPHPMRAGVRHVEGKGIGYNRGYSTAEGFFAPNPLWNDHFVPFVDLRAHFFDNSQPAANAGLGLRYIADRIWGIEERVWGVNAYYDYRKTKRQHYNQVSMGLESLGKMWDFRINGYLPVGDKKTSLYHTKFDGFQGNSMILSSKRQFALKGADAEFGVHVDNLKNNPFYFAAGSYYLTGEGRTSWGGKARATVQFFDYCKLEGRASYDSLFNWIWQGELSIVIPFGQRKTVRKREVHSCSMDLALRRRAFQSVDRHEIIPTDKKEIRKKAIDPTTGQPFFFWFVDNTSHSAGTFESPFHSLTSVQDASAEGHIIYVFPGDGTTKGLDTGIVLKDDQKLFGSSLAYDLKTTFGTFTIPAHSTDYPKLTAPIGYPVITIGNRNQISGLDITASGLLFAKHGIKRRYLGPEMDPSRFIGANFAYEPNETIEPMIRAVYCIGSSQSNFESATITNNVLRPNNYAFGIELENGSGEIVATENTIIGDGSWGIGIASSFSGQTANVRYLNNALSNLNAPGIVVVDSGSVREIDSRQGPVPYKNPPSFVTATVSDNQIDACNYNPGILIYPTGSSHYAVNTERNQLTNCDTGIAMGTFSNASLTTGIQSNQFSNHASMGVFIMSSNNSSLDINMHYNEFIENKAAGALVEILENVTANTSLQNNTYTKSGLFGSMVESRDSATTCSRFNVNVSETKDNYMLNNYSKKRFSLMPPEGNIPNPSMSGTTPGGCP